MSNQANRFHDFGVQAEASRLLPRKSAPKKSPDVLNNPMFP